LVAHVLVSVTIGSERSLPKTIRELAVKHGVEIGRLDIIYGEFDLFVTVEAPFNAFSEFAVALKNHPDVMRSVEHLVAESILGDKVSSIETSV